MFACFIIIVATISDLCSETQNHAISNYKESKHSNHSIKVFKLYLFDLRYFQLQFWQGR